MIKVVGLLTRKPELTHEQFVKHWLEIHGPLAHAVPGIRRYVQSHIVGTRTRPDIPETDVEVDGIAELWYDDQAALARAAASPEMKRLTDDGALFIGRIKTYIIDEKQIIPTGLIAAGGLGHAASWPAPAWPGPHAGHRHIGDCVTPPRSLTVSTASYGKRFTFSMFMPSMRSSRVEPSRRGECSTPISYRYASPGFIA